MAKFIKSIFHPSERRKSRYEEGEEDKAVAPPLDGRRKLSISRSGRMRQANKKRHSLSLELYNQVSTFFDLSICFYVYWRRKGGSWVVRVQPRIAWCPPHKFYLQQNLSRKN